MMWLKTLLIIIVVALGGIFFLQGDGVLTNHREVQSSIELEIGLWTSETRIEQTFVASQNGLAKIDFWVDSYRPWDSPYLECRLFEILSEKNPLELPYEFIQEHRREVRVTRMNGWTISPHMFANCSFAPIVDSSKKGYLLSIQSPALKRGGTSILLASASERYSYWGNLFVDGNRREGDLAFRILYAQPRDLLIQKAVTRLSLEKPFPFSHPISYYMLFSLYALLLFMLLFFLWTPEKHIREEDAKSDSQRRLYMRFLLFSFFIPISLSIIGLQKRLWRKWSPQKEPLAILVIQLQKIGDLVCTTPVFRELRSHYPHARIAVMVLPLTAGILQHSPSVDEIILYDSAVVEGSLKKTFAFIRTLFKHRFDWSINLSPNFQNIAYTCFAAIPYRIGLESPYVSRMTKVFYRTYTDSLQYNSRTSAAEAYLDLLQFLDIAEYSLKKEMYVHAADSATVKEFLTQNQVRQEDRLVALHPFAGVLMKEWGQGKFLALAEQLIERYGVKIVLIGSVSDWEKAQKMQKQTKCDLINGCGKFSLTQLPALLQQCQALISVDTGPLYIANAIGVPVVNIAGPCDLTTQSPDGNCEIVQKAIDCVPCSFIMQAPRHCHREDRKCLEIITVDDVLKAFERLYTICN